MYVEEEAQPRWQHDMRNLQPMDLVYDMIRYDMLRCMYLDRYLYSIEIINAGRSMDSDYVGR